MDLAACIRDIPDFPKEGILFKDITTLLKDAAAFKESIDQFTAKYKDKAIDVVIGVESRGFIFGAVLAYKLNVGFIPVRKKGKLPYKTIGAAYTLEYGDNEVEMHEDAIEKGEKIIIVDDLIATGGTIAAAAKLVEKLGGEILELAFIIELPDLHGREKIEGYKIFTLTEFEGE